MATTNYSIQGKSNPVKIFIRFSIGRGADFTRSTNLIIMKEHWNSKTQRVRDVIACQNRDLINQQLAKLEIFIIDEFNKDFMTGEIINGNWLTAKIGKFFNRPKDEIKLKNVGKDIYLTDFADYWIETKSARWKTRDGYMDEKTIGQYKVLVNIIKRFEGQNETFIKSENSNRMVSVFKGGDKIQLRNINQDTLDDFAEYLRDKEGYAYKTATRMIGRFRFFCFRAEEENIAVNAGFKAKTIVAKEKEDYKYVYLDENEISKLFRYDFSFDKELDNIRDLYVISLYTGLRCEDFLTHLNISKFNDGFIEVKTEKTSTDVVIPVHPYIAAILKKRKGNLPGKTWAQNFNKKIKIIGQILEFDALTLGGIAKIDNVTKKKRKVVANYKKYELLSSHSGRRSMANNLFGIIPNSDICKILGWANENMLFNYIQKTSKDSAKVLQKHWENIKL